MGTWQVYIVGGIVAVEDPGATTPGDECEDPDTAPEGPDQKDGSEAGGGGESEDEGGDGDGNVEDGDKDQEGDGRADTETSKPRPVDPNNPNNPNPLPGYEGGGRKAPRLADGSGRSINNPFTP